MSVKYTLWGVADLNNVSVVYRGQRAASDFAVTCLWKSSRAHQNPKEQRRGRRRQVFLQRRLQTQTIQDQNKPDPDERDRMSR